MEYEINLQFKCTSCKIICEPNCKIKMRRNQWPKSYKVNKDVPSALGVYTILWKSCILCCVK